MRRLRAAAPFLWLVLAAPLVAAGSGAACDGRMAGNVGAGGGSETMAGMSMPKGDGAATSLHDQVPPCESGVPRAVTCASPVACAAVVADVAMLGVSRPTLELLAFQPIDPPSFSVPPEPPPPRA